MSAHCAPGSTGRRKRSRSSLHKPSISLHRTRSWDFIPKTPNIMSKYCRVQSNYKMDLIDTEMSTEFKRLLDISLKESKTALPQLLCSRRCANFHCERRTPRGGLPHLIRY